MTEQENKSEPATICPIHDVVDAICGGPHKEVFTDLGWEVMKEDQEPIGKELLPSPDDELNRWSVLNRAKKGQ